MTDSEEIKRRRTFAIISHPDAGKTTLTEKLLLYGGAIHLAGSVKARKTSRYAVSDWMEIEKQRGISVTSSVLQFDYNGCRINILDTPGHADFSEDTYRTLMAVDSAVMVIDVAKGVEAQTKKLFKVCSDRGIPIFTFVNTWNDYFLQLVMLTSKEKWTLPLAIANLQGEMSSDFGLIMAGAALAAIPIIVVFMATTQVSTIVKRNCAIFSSKTTPTA